MRELEFDQLVIKFDFLFLVRNLAQGSVGMLYFFRGSLYMAYLVSIRELLG